MSDESVVADVVQSVLEFEGLREGLSSVSRYDTEDAPFGANVSVFNVHLNGLTSCDIAERVFLCSDVEAAQRVSTQLVECSPEVLSIVVGPPDGTHATMDARVIRESFDEFLSRLCSVPGKLFDQVLARARRDFDRSKYEQRYQERRVRLLHSPHIGDIPEPQNSATDYLLEWASVENQRYPILLLGERGSGKTWQMFRFCERVLDEHQQHPWLYGPALYFDLRHVAADFGSYRQMVPLFADRIVREYREMKYRWGSHLAEAFLMAGHTTICIDGFEEVHRVVHGDDEAARSFLQLVCSSLPLGTRFILACRATHFGSLRNLLDIEAWPDRKVGDYFEVLSLEPLSRSAVGSYVDAAATVAADAKALRWIDESREKAGPPLDRDAWRAGLREAVRICSSYPALLAAMVDESILHRDRDLPPTALLKAALVGGVIRYNVEMGKASERHLDRGNVIHVGTEERLALLGHLAWYLAARGCETLDLKRLPPWLAEFYHLDVDAIRKDVRTHTLLEVAPEPRTAGDAESADSATREILRFAVRPADPVSEKAFPQDEAAVPPEKDEQASALTDVALQAAPVGVTSVSGAFVLANYIVQTLEMLSDIPLPADAPGSLPPLDRVRPFGQIALSPAAAAIVRELLTLKTTWHGSLSALGTGPEALVRLVSDVMGQCAARRDCSVFSPCLRYVGHNLEAMGLLETTEARRRLDPWFGEDVRSVVRAPSRLPGYHMVLIPRAPESATPRSLAAKGIADSPANADTPVVMGVSEVTNADFYSFVQSVEGEDWRVESMTLAGSGNGWPQSRHAHLANEYYLYFWQTGDGHTGPRYRPLRGATRDPVVYVSWYACAFFCDWLTAGEKMDADDAQYAHHFRDVDRDTQPMRRRRGYRLPSVREWSWAARGGRLDVQFPWELFPVALPESARKAWGSGATDVDTRVQQWLGRWRDVYMKYLLGASKEHLPVLSDPFNQFGTSGLMGNVKEWCHDAIGTADDRSGKHSLVERAILGATGYLEASSFDFNYGVSLFPRNTNPDVGFRVCRPISDTERGVLEKREAAIAAANGY